MIFIARFALGERFRKATPADMRLHSSCFALIPIFIELFGHLGKSVMDKGTYLIIVLYMSAFVIGFWIAIKIWIRFIPTMVSWIIGGIEWTAMFYLALTGRLL